MFKGLILVGVLILATNISGQRLRRGPIDVCQSESELIADIGSCTRYHRCRLIPNTSEFTTDIAICPNDSVFDMVNSSCIPSVNVLQDPGSCDTFYGCHPTRETSEGLLRLKFWCSGDLRFHPVENVCTFKTNVPDYLCNSLNPVQRIIGNFNVGDASNIGTIPFTRVIRPRPSSRLANINPNIPNSLLPSAESSLDQIAQVISGQLLSLQNET